MILIRFSFRFSGIHTEFRTFCGTQQALGLTIRMAPQYESLPLVTNYGTGKLEDSPPGNSNVRRVSSIPEELGPTPQKGTASVVNVSVNMAKTAGKLSCTATVIFSAT